MVFTAEARRSERDAESRLMPVETEMNFLKQDHPVCFGCHRVELIYDFVILIIIRITLFD
jgi:hypothetical protein